MFKKQRNTILIFIVATLSGCGSMKTSELVSDVRSSPKNTCIAEPLSALSNVNPSMLRGDRRLLDKNGQGASAAPAVALLVAAVLRAQQTPTAEGQGNRLNAITTSAVANGVFQHAPGRPDLDILAEASDATSSAVVQATALARSLSLQSARDNQTALEPDLPTLKSNKVFQALVQAATASAARAQTDIAPQSSLTAAQFVPAGNDTSLAVPGALTPSDFKTFALLLRDALASKPLAMGGDNLATPAPNASKPTVPIKFKDAFVAYFSAYYKGDYVDHLGVKLAKPALSRTINNTEISGAVQVLWELVLDYKLRTPVWKDSKNLYYPGGRSDEPTIAAAGLVTPLSMLDETDSEHCGITPLKADAIEYLSNLASDKSSSLGGLVGGSFGGLHFGFGVLGKVSIGDNQTLQALVKMALAKAGERAAEEASYRALYWIGYKSGSTLADLVQQYLDGKSPTQ
jgi:hypothetical protein